MAPNFRRAAPGARFSCHAGIPAQRIKANAAEGEAAPVAPGSGQGATEPPPAEGEEAEGVTPKPPVVPPADPAAPPVEPEGGPAKVDATAIYARLNGRQVVTPRIAGLQTGPGPTGAATVPTLDPRAIYARANARR